MVASADIEIKKLREASEKVKYRMENLTPEQKKIMCNLFIERIDINRTREGARWHTHAQVYFRFNLPRLYAEAERVRTQKSLSDNNKSEGKRRSDLSGGLGGT